MRVGDKVKCIDNSAWEQHLKLNKIYTIEELIYHEMFKNEITHVRLLNYSDFGFSTHRFKLITREQKLKRILK